MAQRKDSGFGGYRTPKLRSRPAPRSPGKRPEVPWIAPPRQDPDPVYSSVPHLASPLPSLVPVAAPLPTTQPSPYVSIGEEWEWNRPDLDSSPDLDFIDLGIAGPPAPSAVKGDIRNPFGDWFSYTDEGWDPAIQEVLDRWDVTDMADEYFGDPMVSFVDPSLSQAVQLRKAASILGEDWWGGEDPFGSIFVTPGETPYVMWDGQAFGIAGGPGYSTPLDIPEGASQFELGPVFAPGQSTEGGVTLSGDPILENEDYMDFMNEFDRDQFINMALNDLSDASGAAPHVVEAIVTYFQAMEGEIPDNVDLKDPETLGYYYDLFYDPNAHGSGGGWGDYDYGGGGGGGWGGYEEPAEEVVSWSAYDAGVAGPDWWQPLMPSVLTPVSEYQAYLNAMIPFLSPEDQTTVASLIYQMDPTNFAHLNPANTGGPEIPPEMTADLIEKYTSQMRSSNALMSLQRMLAAMGVDVSDTGEGYRYLTNALTYLQQYGAADGEGQTRAQRERLLRAVQALSDNTSKEASPFSNIIKMLVDPHFATGKISPVYKDQQGNYVFGEANKELF